jgi:Citrate lyase beta subunit
MNKLRRSMLFLPGANAAMLSTAFIYRPDSIMFDLEDAVALREKDTARLLVFHALQHPMYQDIETVVRINPLNTPFGLADLEAVVRAGVDVIRCQKPIPRKISSNSKATLSALSVNAGAKWAPRA